MEKYGKSKEPKKEIQLDLSFEDAPKKENVTIPGEGEFHEDYMEDFEDENEDIPITHLNEEELEKLKEDPYHAPEYYALIKKIEEKEKKEREQAEIDEMERVAFARQKKEEEQEKINKLRDSTIQDFDDNQVIDERDDKTGEYRHFVNIAQQKKEEEIQKKEKLNKKKTKTKKSWWRRGGDSIQDIFDRNNLR